MSTEIKKMLTLKSSDGDEFFLEETVAIQSVTIKNIIGDIGDDGALTVIPLPNVTSETLAKVIEFLKEHADSRVSKDDITEFDNKFVSGVDMGTKLFDLILAANYLDIKDLLDITCQKVADYIKDKTPEEVRTFFNIENDFTPEEEAKIREENPWAYE